MHDMHEQDFEATLPTLMRYENMCDFVSTASITLVGCPYSK